MKTLTRRTAWKLAAGGAAALLTPHAGAQSRQDRGKELVHGALEALGGEKFLAIRNIVTAGRAYSFYRASVRGLARITTYDRFEPMKPNAPGDWLPVSRREVYTEKGDYYALFLNGEGWEVTFQGARPQPDDVMERYRVGVRRDFFYFLRYRLEEQGLYFYSTGVEIVDNIPTEAVQITDYDGEQVTIYFRRSDGLPHRQFYLRRDPKTRIPFEETTIWSQYREVNGAKLPWNIWRERDGDKIYEQFAGSVEVNQNIDKGIFELPRGVRVLQKDI